MTNGNHEENVVRTLADRLAEGRISIEGALRYASLVGEALRRLHDSGRIHGAVSTEAVLLTETGVELTPPLEADEAAGAVAADIFGFGAVLGEMLTSANVMGGDCLETQSAQSPALARLVAGCLTKDRAVRFPGMQKVLLELKLAALSARHAGLQESEARQSARLREQEQNIAQSQQVTTAAVEDLRSQFASFQSRLAIADLNAARFEELRSGLDSAGRHLTALESRFAEQKADVEAVRGSMAQTDDLVGRIVEAIEAKLEAAHQRSEENARRLDSIESLLQSTVRQTAALDGKLTAAMERFDSDIAAQAAIVENVRSSMAQTDDVVGRVVDAVEDILLDLGAVRK